MTYLKKLVIILILFSTFTITSCKGDTYFDLEMPDNFIQKGTTLHWDEVSYADGYIVMVGFKTYEVNSNSIDLSMLIEPQTYEIKVKAISNDIKYTESNFALGYYKAEEIIEHGFDEHGFEFFLLDDKSGYQIQDGNWIKEEELNIPAYFCNLPVKKIMYNGFTYRPKFGETTQFYHYNWVTKRIILPETIEEIGDRAFALFAKVKEIVIPDSVTKLGKASFYECYDLEKVILSKNIKEIPDKCFYNCSLKYVELPDGLEKIESGAFKNDDYLAINGSLCKQKFEYIKIPSSVNYIGNNAFECTLKLKNVEILGDLKYIGINVFAKSLIRNECKMKELIIDDVLFDINEEIIQETYQVPSTVKKIANGLFSNLLKVNNIIIPDGAELCGLMMFNNNNVQLVKLPNTLDEISSYLFGRCNNLRSVIIPKSITQIAQNAFKNCVNIENLYYLGSGSELDQTKWKKDIEIILPNAKVYIYSDNIPTSDGFYWHYAEDGITPISW